MKKSDLEKMLFKLARSTCNYKDEETQSCIKAILSSDIDQMYKDLLNASYKSDKKPMQIVTDFDERTVDSNLQSHNFSHNSNIIDFFSS